MKQNKIIIAILALVLVAGIIFTITKGLNFDTMYSNASEINLQISKEFEVNDVKQITDEIFGKNKVSIRKIELYGDAISITTKELTDEQKQKLVDKVNEKYETELKVEDVKVLNMPHIRVRDMIKQYIMPIAIVAIISLIYLSIRYYKLGFMKVLLKTIGIILLAQAEVFSIIAITRIPVGRTTGAIVLVVYLLTLLGTTINFEKQLKEKNVEENIEE